MNLRAGDTFSFQRTFTQEQFNRFANLSGDDNPIHVDPEFSARTKFGRTVAHGMFLYANICRALAEIVPGVIQLEQELMFPAPTCTGEVVRLEMAVTERPADGTARLLTNITKPDGSFGCQGSVLLAPDDPAVWTVPLAPYKPAEDGVVWKGLVVGQSAALRRTYSATDLTEYLELLDETDPRYSGVETARILDLRGVPLPEPLLGAMFSCLLGTELPGRGTNWLKQRFVFHRAAYSGDELLAQVQITRIRLEKELVNLRTWITGPDGAMICDGEALVWVSDVELGIGN